jgi:hypothetical protein
MKNRKSSMQAIVITLAILAIGLGLRATALYVIAEPAYDPNTVPFPYNKNLVQGTLLGTVTQRAGVAGSVKGTYYDPDNDPVNVRIVSGPVGMLLKQDPTTGSYVLSWTPAGIDVGVKALVLAAKDTPPTGTALEATGTILWQVMPQNQTPGLVACGNIDLRKAVAP